MSERSVSIVTMIEQCEGLLGTNDLTDWESEFIDNMVERLRNGEIRFTPAQKDRLIDIYHKHFA